MSNSIRKVLTLLSSIFLFHFATDAQPVAERGVIDARIFDFASQRLNLQGDWLWIDGALADVNEVDNATPVEFPKTWNDVRTTSSGQGTATYYLTVLLPSTFTEFAIELPQIYSSYRLWVNGEMVGANGVPGETAETTKPQWMPQTVSFRAQNEVKIVLQIANFHHHKGGCKDPIYLGELNTMKMKDTISMTSKLIECGVLLLIAIIFFALYFAYGRKKVAIYFSLLCATWSVRSVFSNDYTFIQFFPDFDWNLMIRIEYITLYLTMMWAILYLGRLFYNDGSQIIKYVLVTLNGIFIAFTVLNPPTYFTKMLAVYLVTSGILLLYGAIVVVRALINERIGATFLTISVLMGIAIFSYDIFTYEGIFSYNSVVISAGYLIIFLLMGAALLLHLGIIKSSPKASNTLTYDDLYGDNKK